YSLAARKANGWGAEYRDPLILKMPSDQIVEGQRRVDKFIARTETPNLQVASNATNASNTTATASVPNSPKALNAPIVSKMAIDACTVRLGTAGSKMHRSDALAIAPQWLCMISRLAQQGECRLQSVNCRIPRHGVSHWRCFHH